MIRQKQERLKEVFEHLRRYYGVHTQIDFAHVVGLTRPAISSALNGNEAYLTDNLFKRICAAYQGVFNLDYLLTGNGQLLTLRENENDVTQNQDSRNVTSQSNIDISSVFNAALAAKDQVIAQMELRLSEKDKYIAILEKRIADYESAAAFIKDNNFIDNWPFPKGVAEEIEKRNTLRG